MAFAPHADPDGVFLEGFDHWSNGQDSAKWTTHIITPVTSAPGRDGTGQKAGLVQSDHAFLAATTVIVGFAVFWGDAFDFSTLVSLNSSLGSQVIALKVLPGGFIRITYNGVDYDGTDPSQVITARQWQYIELGVFRDAAASTFRVRKDGVIVTNLNRTGLAGSANNPDYLRIGNSLNNLIDDLYCVRGTGGYSASDPGDFWGDTVIDTLYPNAAGTFTDMVPTAVPNYDCVNETGTFNDDQLGGDYVAESTVGNKDTYNFPDLSTAVVSEIKAVQLNVIGRKTDTGISHSVAPIHRQDDATVTAGPTLACADTLKDYRWAMRLNPRTAAAWVITGGGSFNTSQFGQKIIS